MGPFRTPNKFTPVKLKANLVPINACKNDKRFCIFIPLVGKLEGAGGQAYK